MDGKNLVNYGASASNLNNYTADDTSSCSESFPNSVGNGVFVEYKQMNYASEILEDADSLEQADPSSD